MSVFILPYRNGSASVAALCKNLKVKRIKLRGSKFVPKMSKVVVNWGNSEMIVDSYHWLNVPAAVRVATSKSDSLKYMSAGGVPCVEILSTEKAVHCVKSGDPVVLRYVNNGHGGKGIVVCKSYQELDTAIKEKGMPRLFTKYFKGREEYRIHVAGDEMFDAQQKRKRADAENVVVEVRNHDNGWVFCREDVVVPDVVRDAAVQAVAALGLDFGAVDIKYNEKANTCAVLEVNTAPGLEGTTLEKYCEKIMELVQQFGV